MHIIGGPGSGKTVLATRLAAILALTPDHLDSVARVGGGTGPARPMSQRIVDVAEIAARPAWVTEGLELDWTDALIERAEMVIWLDTVGWAKASRRITGRFVGNAVAEMRRRRGRERFLRMRDYLRHLRDLVGGVRETRGYYPSVAASGSEGPSHRQTQERLAREGHKVVRCRSSADVERLVARFGTSAAADQ